MASQGMEVHTHIQWAEIIRTEVIPVRGGMVDIMELNIFNKGNKGKLNGRCRN